MALKCCRSQALARCPLLSSPSFNLSTTDTINLGASQASRGPTDASVKCIILERAEFSTASQVIRADKSDYLQRSSKVCFHHEGGAGFKLQSSGGSCSMKPSLSGVVLPQRFFIFFGLIVLISVLRPLSRHYFPLLFPVLAACHPPFFFSFCRDSAHQSALLEICLG